MRSLCLAAVSAMFLAIPAFAQSCAEPRPAGTARLVVTATTVRDTRGEIAFTVYPDDPSRFLAKGGKLTRQRLPAAAPVTRACFWLRPGYYAIATYHDANGDRNFNRSLFNVKEGFGFSNDAPATLGLPRYAATRFLVPAGGAEIRIRTRYPN